MSFTTRIQASFEIAHSTVKSTYGDLTTRNGHIICRISYTCTEHKRHMISLDQCLEHIRLTRIQSFIKAWILMVLLSYALMALAIKWFANRYKTSTNPVLRFISDYCASICKCLSALRSKKVRSCCSCGFKLAREFT